MTDTFESNKKTSSKSFQFTFIIKRAQTIIFIDLKNKIDLKVRILLLNNEKFQEGLQIS